MMVRQRQGRNVGSMSDSCFCSPHEFSDSSYPVTTKRAIYALRGLCWQVTLHAADVLFRQQIQTALSYLT